MHFRFCQYLPSDSSWCQSTEMASSSDSTHCDRLEITFEKIFYMVTKGIDISDFTTVTNLNLSKCNLRNLPSNLSVLKLTHLNLSCNRLEEAPVCLYNGLKELVFLDLSNNRITHFDREPDCIKTVKVINLSLNNFSNVPKWFLMFKATNLEEFSYSDNKAKHYNYLKNSYNCSKNRLVKLELSNCRLIDCDLKFLRLFKHLRYLDIGNEHYTTYNNFADLDQLFVKLQWKDLNVLKVNKLGFACVPNGIFWIRSLVELHINHNFVSWLPHDIRYLINLEILEVSNNCLVGLPSILTELTQLKMILASNNRLEMVPDFTLLKNLRVLDLYNNVLEEVSINVSELRFVDIEMNYFNTNVIHNSLLYHNKKGAYRETLHKYRLDGYKLDEDVSTDCDSASCSDYEDSGSDIGTHEYSKKLEDDNWDLDLNQVPRYQRSPEVDTDDDWIGEGYVNMVKQNGSGDKIYVLDEDWMFEDVLDL